MLLEQQLIWNDDGYPKSHLYLLPSDFQIQLYCPKVIDIHSDNLRLSSKQVFRFTSNTSNQNMSGKTFNFCDLWNKLVLIIRNKIIVN